MVDRTNGESIMDDVCGFALPARPATLADLISRYAVTATTLRTWQERGVFPRPAARIGCANIWCLDAVEKAETAAAAANGQRGFPFAARRVLEAMGKQKAPRR
jgi:hypothetical protein